MLVKAGSAVDAFIDKLLPLLEKGDIIIDGGNSEYTDSQVRMGGVRGGGGRDGRGEGKRGDGREGEEGWERGREGGE